MMAVTRICRQGFFLHSRFHWNKTSIPFILSRKFSANNANIQSEYDVVIVGGGIVGMATARELIMRHPKLTFAVLEKENKLACHQSGHNSGVIHAGIYYTPGSLKAKLCVEGLKLTYAFCDKHNIPYRKCGKLIVATNQEEVKRLDNIMSRGVQNNVPDLKMVNSAEIRDIEPHCKGVKAVWSPHTGIVDWALVTEYYAKDFKEFGGHIHLNFPVSSFQEVKEGATGNENKYPVEIKGHGKSVKARYVLTCGGLHADRLAEMSGCSREPRIVPFRGEYLLLNQSKAHLIRGNIYPVPDPRFPFLGVHFTPRMDGSVWLGPNAILAFKREGYRWGDIDLNDLLDTLKFPGFQKLAAKYAFFGMSEMIKSIFIRLQLKELQKYVPEVTAADIQRGPAGVRAQAMDLAGTLVEDFVFDSGTGPLASRVLHCRNAPSPGATSSMAIAKMIADKLQGQFQL